ncbi:enoyl-CoA hydratase [Rhodococcus sp. SC4]|nr:enoyl-CoA hydratase [Rhodococcus sp. SC4]
MTRSADLEDRETSPILTSRSGTVLTITLHRPHRMNALTTHLYRELVATLHSAERDPDVRAVVLTGSNGNFCSGADVEAGRSDHPLDRMRTANSVASALADFPKPIIAKVDGYAVGAGWNIALLCDFVVASSTAKFSQIFARRGLSVDFGGSWLLPRLVGLQQAKRLVLLAETINAHEAFDLGLVTWIKETDEIDAFTQDLAERLAAGPPVALAQSKALLAGASSSTLREALDNEARAVAVNFATDAPDAFKAFAEKRPPKFTGKWRIR